MTDERTPKKRNRPERKPRTGAPLRLKRVPLRKTKDAALAGVANAIEPYVPRSTQVSNTAYDPVTAAEILTLVAEGKTLKQALAMVPGAPHPRTWQQWLWAKPELKKIWEDAKLVRATSLFDRVQELAERLEVGQYTAGDASKVNALRTAIEAFKWAAGKLSPHEYGERPNVTAVAVTINTGLDLGQSASVAPADASVYTLEAKIVEPENPLMPKEPAHDPKAKDRSVSARPRNVA